MAVFKFGFDEKEYQRLQSGEINDKDFLNNVINTEANRKSIIEQLLSYHEVEGGIEVKGFDITEATYNPSTQNGKVTLTYTRNYFYTCSDIKKNYADKETWAFKIDADNRLLIIDAPDLEVLSPGDEF
ncbi:hypothetical protein [Mucilaginibacter agri]|uniref:Uncharacterized protein n=1 Tax=Mucilaginibacter agri TaxID=2695265 RepID=A0A965ZG34_9SPHI|nr:hypothetical protein [Mucilaginibacter agri]NCD69152.1 hypothetical protein [Mucilaginibacter agri]